ncbi:Protein kinase superfamily protein [Zostera marina]|uniref:Protein kinase superfamily protein n=1 Tax=Zostera marina TaxID=29655 RepID=A0A0K9PF04_ZOSMR|nr:Protein kinase superfamily protein [Zostera marina]
MSDELLMQLTSNSNPTDNSSLTNKLAKLEARMAGKGSASSVPSPANASQKLPVGSTPTMEAMQGVMYSSDSDEDHGGGGYLIQANNQKRQRMSENIWSSEETDDKIKMDTMELRSAPEDSNRKRQVRGRGRNTVGKNRGSKVIDRTTSSGCSTPNGQVEKVLNKGTPIKELFDHSEKAKLQEEISLLTLKVASLEDELRKARNDSSLYQRLQVQLEKELVSLQDSDKKMKAKRLKVLSDLLISVSRAERQEARMKIRQDSLRLGCVGVIRAGTVISETWEDGQVLKDITAHLKSLLETKEVIERQRKLLKKRQSDKGDGSDAEIGISEEDYLLQDELFKTRLASIKREEDASLRERERYELEKARLIREMKRVRDEDGSRFNNFQILSNRYALLNLLGKGGFSEVYKAYDLVENRYVACKLHGLNAQWNELKKQSYIRHAIREYNIHKTLVHPHIVRLWDIFEIDHNAFCTVLEYCSGKDLDMVIKATPVLSEREARIIIVQIFQGLVYLNKRQQKIIHYDLKPGNVIFDEIGVAKVTDFGLSKIVENDVGSQGMELTSQGAGTYWYLPPECFDLSKTPLISSKVDVWSAGVIFYQMLFGRRPFGHDQSQERILREDTIINARKVEFPTKPSVSIEAKDLIRQCLTYDQAERPDVLTIAQNPYLSYVKR